MKKSKFTWLHFRIVLIVGIGIIILLIAIQSAIQTVFESAEIPPKAIVSNNLGLTELWRWSGHILGEQAPKVIIQDGYIILGSSENKGNRIMVFEAQTGDLKWKSDFTFENVQSLASDTNNVYAGYTKYVQAYDLETGKKLWTGAKQSVYKKGFLYVYSHNDQVEVYDASSEWPHDERVFILDTQNGQTINTIEWLGVFFRWGDIIYSRTGSTDLGYDYDLVAQDQITKDILWRLPVNSFPRRWPVIVNNVMYLDAGDIYALNPNTGELYWQSETTIGADDWTYLPDNDGTPRMAFSDDILYVVRNNGSIISLDAKTGQELGVFEISPLPIYYDEETGHYPLIHYAIAASDDFVAVYYDDSQELIVFERTDAPH